jgi:hypothetical protein
MMFLQPLISYPLEDKELATRISFEMHTVPDYNQFYQFEFGFTCCLNKGWCSTKHKWFSGLWLVLLHLISLLAGHSSAANTFSLYREIFRNTRTKFNSIHHCNIGREIECLATTLISIATIVC